MSGKDRWGQLVRVSCRLAPFLFGKTRKVQRFLYHSRPRSTGAEEKETDYGTDQTCPQSYGH
nr:MAG TPA: hypothetical protein [Caudoviricetes sp.]